MRDDDALAANYNKPPGRMGQGNSLALGRDPLRGPHPQTRPPRPARPRRSRSDTSPARPPGDHNTTHRLAGRPAGATPPNTTRAKVSRRYTVYMRCEVCRIHAYYVIGDCFILRVFAARRSATCYLLGADSLAGRPRSTCRALRLPTSQADSSRRPVPVQSMFHTKSYPLARK